MTYDKTDPDYLGDKELPEGSIIAYGYVNPMFWSNKTGHINFW